MNECPEFASSREDVSAALAALCGPTVNALAQQLTMAPGWGSLTTFQQEQRITRTFLDWLKRESLRIGRAAEGA